MGRLYRIGTKEGVISILNSHTSGICASVSPLPPLVSTPRAPKAGAVHIRPTDISDATVAVAPHHL